MSEIGAFGLVVVCIFIGFMIGGALCHTAQQSNVRDYMMDRGAIKQEIVNREITNYLVDESFRPLLKKMSMVISGNIVE